MVVCIIVYVLQRVGGSCALETLLLKFPEAPSTPVCDLQCQEPCFDVRYGSVDPTCEVEVFNAIVGQDNMIIQVGDFVRLSTPWQLFHSTLLCF